MIRSRVIKLLRTMHVSHAEKNLYDMDVVREIGVEDDGRVRIIFVPPSDLCPVGINLAFEVKRKVKRIDGVKSVDLRVRGFQEDTSIVRFDD